MNHQQEREYLIKYLLKENKRYRGMELPGTDREQRDLLRALMNVRAPGEISSEFLRIQDDYLGEELRLRGVVSEDEWEDCGENIFLWQGDITRLRVDAIVNAANSGMTGCYQPLHNCIDNCIHTYAGVQLRCTCGKMMDEQGHAEPTGQAKVTPGYNLPCRAVIHTVGPIVRGALTKEDERLLASCYESCLRAAEENGFGSIAFCCISTGVFGFPQRRAAEIAVKTVRNYRAEKGSAIKVVFNVFKDEDYEIYRNLLGQNQGAEKRN